MGLSKFILHITFWIFLQYLIKVKSQRVGHTATLINNKLYILGGGTLSSKAISDTQFFYFDFSVPFSIYGLKRQTLDIGIVPPHQFATAVNGGVNNDTLILYTGGASEITKEVMAPVFAFDTQSNSWRIAKTTGLLPGTLAIPSVIDDKGVAYFFGGLIPHTSVSR